MTQFKQDIDKANEDFYISEYSTINNKKYHRVRVLSWPCKIKLYHYNKLIDELDYNHGVSHYIESLRDFKRQSIYINR